MFFEEKKQQWCRSVFGKKVSLIFKIMLNKPMQLQRLTREKPVMTKLVHKSKRRYPNLSKTYPSSKEAFAYSMINTINLNPRQCDTAMLKGVRDVQKIISEHYSPSYLE